MASRRNAYGETRAEMKQRLMSEGRWQQYLAERRALEEEHPDWGYNDIKTTMEGRYPPLFDGEAVDAELDRPEVEADAELIEDAVDDSAVMVAATGTARFRREDVEWVYANMGVKSLAFTKKRLEADAPSPGAYGLWAWAVKSPANESEFYRNFLAKLLPSKSQIDTDDARFDDGSSVEDTCKAILREIEVEDGGSEVEPSNPDSASGDTPAGAGRVAVSDQPDAGSA